MFDFIRKLRPESALSYVAWRMRKRAGSINLALRSGPRFELRGDDSTNNDYGVAYEVFVHDYYGRTSLLENGIRLIVDLGANVGYSVLYFLHQYPSSQVIAFEPHTSHVRQLERNLLLDGNRDRVKLYAKAAGARTRLMRLTDSQTSSSLTEDHSLGTLPVEVIDIFPLLSTKHIDVLKMDIEGGEYEILADERFATLDIQVIAMEWHSRGGGIGDKEWCERRLTSLGFAVEEIFTKADYGMFWAIRR